MLQRITTPLAQWLEPISISDSELNFSVLHEMVHIWVIAVSKEVVDSHTIDFISGHKSIVFRYS